LLFRGEDFKLLLILQGTLVIEKLHDRLLFTANEAVGGVFQLILLKVHHKSNNF
jgi:hypothetical protein